MEIRITTNQILKVLQILSWIIFIGLCIEVCGIAFNTFYTFFINPVNIFSFWMGTDLSELYRFDQGYFIAITLIMIIVSGLKAMMFYLIVKLCVDKKLNMSQPFSTELRHFILKLSYLAFAIGLFSHFGLKYSYWITGQDVMMPDMQSLQIAGADVWLFMAVILFVIVQIVKRGIEIQTENDLTI